MAAVAAVASVAMVRVVPRVHALCPVPEEMPKQAVHAEVGAGSAAAPRAALRSMCVAPPACIAKHGVCLL